MSGISEFFKRIFSQRNNDAEYSTKKRKTRLQKFLLSFFITLGATVVVGFIIGYFYLTRAVIVPPEIRPIQQPIRPPQAGNSQNSNSDNNDNDNDNDNDEQFPYWYNYLVAPEGFTDADRRDNFFTFMIVGLNDGRNANTVMVASYDTVAREANLISIPRDSLLAVNRNGRRIAASYIAGSGGGRGREGGISALQRDVFSIIGFVPDIYVILDYDAFFAIIDAVGGIDVYVPFHMRYDDPFQNLFIDIPAGQQTLDAETALHFARFRQSNVRGFHSPPNSDYFRIESQQAIINAVISRLLRPQNLLRIPEFVDIFNDAVHTNLNVGNMLYFARELNHIRGTDALNSFTMPMAGTTGHPTWYEILNAREVVNLVNETINPFYRDIELRDVNIVSQ